MVRVAISISCVLRRVVHLSNIRAGRSFPCGLSPNHVCEVQVSV